MSRTMTVVAVALLTICWASPVAADVMDLSDGVFITHYTPEIQYTSPPPPEGWCAAYEAHAITDCSGQNPQVFVDGEYETICWYVLTAWEEPKEWCGVQFGIEDFGLDAFGFIDSEPCYPPGGGLEIASNGWPGPNEGTAIVATGDESWTGNFVPVYWFAGYAYGPPASDIIQLGRDMTAPDSMAWFGGFGNCAQPPDDFPVAEGYYGGLGINVEGVGVCPPGWPQVCCVESDCYLIPVGDCDDLSGEWHMEWNTCDPNPCLCAMTMIYPNGTESLCQGEQIEITWDAYGSCGSSARLELYYGGESCATIAESTENDGAYTWIVAPCDTHEEDYTIRVTDLEVGSYDDSDATFAIHPPCQLALLGPNGGESYCPNDSVLISWSYTECCGDSVSLALLNDSVICATISSATENDGEYAWLASPCEGTPEAYQVRVTDLTTSDTDDSDAQFTIWPPCPLTLTYPNGGESFCQPEEIEITWESGTCCGDSVTILLELDGAVCDTIATLTPNDGGHAWNVAPCGAETDDYTIRITDPLSGVSDASDGPFSIHPPCSLSDVAPNGGEFFCTGDPVDISWVSTECCGPLVSIVLLYDGVVCDTIAVSLPDDGHHLWNATPCDVPGDGYQVRVTDLTTLEYDESDESFTIAPACELTVSYPNGGEALYEGEQIEITWELSPCCGDNIHLLLALDGAVCDTIAALTANDGSHYWLATPCGSEITGYTIQVVDPETGTSDESDGPFGIHPRYVVRADGSGDYATIQDAIDAATDGYIIELEDGVYTGLGNRDLTCHGKSIILRSSSADPTVCTIDCEGSPAEPHRGFVFNLGEGSDTIVQDLTITGGAGYNEGGAILCEAASPTISGCVLTANSADVEGGGIYCRDCNPALVRCTVVENSAAEDGGGMYCRFSFLTLTSCTFAGNSATTGAALYAGSSSQITIQNAIIAYQDGDEAVACYSGGSVALTCCDVYGNAGGDWVGCIAAQENTDGNFSEDPLFCGEQNPVRPYSLQGGSPCTPYYNPSCGLIGAWEVGCDARYYACCIGEECQLLTWEECNAADGEWRYDVESCDPNPCLPVRACCVGPWCLLMTVEECTDAGGEWMADIESCDPSPCELIYACCVGENCQLLTQDECASAGGEWLQGAHSCDPNPCVLPDSVNLSGGALIVHAPPGVQWSTGEDWCQRYWDDFAISSSYQQVNRIDPPEGAVSLWYVLAAWDEPKQWCGVEFGLADFQPDIFYFVDWGACNAGGLEIPTDGWPGPHEGTALVVSDTPWSGNYVPIYWFGGYAYYEGEIPLSFDPPTSFAGFGNCEIPPQAFDASCLGGLGIYQDGSPCYLGTSPVYACCEEFECQLMTRPSCDNAGGVWLWGEESCDPNPCLPAIYLVLPDGSGDYPTIQAAIDAASDGDLIELADGTFTGDGNRDLDYRGKTVTVRSQNDDPTLCVIDCGGSENEPHRGFHFHSREGSDAQLQGITITNGYHENGGGIRCDQGCVPQIANCILEANTAPESGGGGMYCYLCAPTLSNCDFLGNAATGNGTGGALYLNDSPVTLTSCDFHDNSAYGAGAIYCYSGSPTLEECIFSGNMATVRGGAMSCSNGALPNLNNCTIAANSAPYGGGGLYCTTSAAAVLEKTIIAFSTQGEALTCAGDAGDPILSCCNLFGNAGGDWVGCIADQLGQEGNFSADPAFCDAAEGDYSISSVSLCAPSNNPGCGLVGVHPVGCGPPVAPSELSATVAGGEAILVDWCDNATDEIGSELERRLLHVGSWTLLQTLPADSSSWADSLVTWGELYIYRVRAWNDNGYSAYSNQDGALVGIPPAAPTDLVATAVSPTGIDLSWVDQADHEVGFHIQRRVPPAGYWRGVEPNPIANSESYADRGLTPATEYAYRLQAYNEYGHSEWSNIAGATTEQAPGGFEALIRVRLGTVPVGQAMVLVASGSGFQAKGLTDASGELEITGLEVGDSIRVQKRMAERASVKDGHEAVGDLMWDLWLDSDMMQEGGDYVPHVIEHQQYSYLIPVTHPTFVYHLVVSIGPDIPAGSPYWDDFETAFNDASSYLYNASDGQILLGDIAVYDAQDKWYDADIRIYSLPRPFADNDGIFKPSGIYGHINMGNIYAPTDPDEPEYSVRLAQLICQYALGLWEENRNGWGLESTWQQYRNAHPEECPDNYGLMDHAMTTTEMSSANDYLREYPYLVERETVTLQYYLRRMSCWDWVQQRLRSYQLGIELTKPPYGWYPHNVTADRLGPALEIGLAADWDPHNGGYRIPTPVRLQRIDSGPGSYGADLVLQTATGPAGRATVYRVDQRGMTYLGRTRWDGEMHAGGLREGDRLRVYQRTARGATRTEFEVSAADLSGATVEYSIPMISCSAGASGNRDDERAPGATVDARPQGSLSEPAIALDLWADEPLGVDPTVVCFYGTVIESLDVVWHPDDERYSTEIWLDPEVPEYDSRGYFEITLADSVANTTTFLADFSLSETIPGAPSRMWSGDADLQILTDPDAEPQLALATSSNPVPFTPPGFTSVPVSDLHAVQLAGEGPLPSEGGLNIAYDDSMLVGLDETSLVLMRWEAAAHTWNEVAGASIDMPTNMTSAIISEGGVFCIFATSTSTDTTPPGIVMDFGAIGGEGQGTVQLDWTAPGDDEMEGTALQYIIAYADSGTTITEAVWNQLPKLPGIAAPEPVGTFEMRSVVLPDQDRLYYLALRTRDEAGNLSGISNAASAISGMTDPNYLPGAPGRVRALDAPEDDGGVARLTWDLSADDGAGKETVVGYRIYRSEWPSITPAYLDSVLAGIGDYDDQNAENAALFTYWVSASDGEREVFSVANQALAADNIDMPVGDFSSDSVVAVDDFSLLVNTYAIDSTNAEFDPLFDLDGSGDIYTGDFALLESHFSENGVPDCDPPGQNDSVRVYFEVVEIDPDVWSLDITIQGVLNLAGYSFMVRYPDETLTWTEISPDLPGGEGNILNREGGVTPLFLVREPTPGDLWIAYVVQRPTADTAPDGDGELGQVLFAGTGIQTVNIREIVFIDHLRLMNYLPSASDVAELRDPVRAFLFQNQPNPFCHGTTIRFQLPRRCIVTLATYDVAGRLVRTIVDGIQDPGIQAFFWDGRSKAGYRVGSGVYFYRIETPGYTMTRKMLLVR